MRPATLMLVKQVKINLKSINVIGFIIVVAIIIGIGIAITKSQELKRLQSEYQSALRGNDKSRALNAGRAYYAKLRGNNTLTIYDEQAISNDLSAMKIIRSQAPVHTANGNMLDKLERLTQLKLQGTLTEEEFNRQKERILQEK